MHSISRRMFLGMLLAGSLARSAFAAPERITVEVWKDPACGCCNDWIRHLEENGFSVTSHDTGHTAARTRLGMPAKFASCHTARVGAYIVEGHVPAADIRRLLRERPTGVGLAVPAMPIGSPGMDGPEYRGRKDPYDVLLVHKGGRASVFQSYR